MSTEPMLLRLEEITHVGFVDVGANQEDGEGSFIEIWKRAETFAESKNQEDLRSEVWRISDQIGSAFRSALFDAEEDDDPEAVILTSLDQFQTAVKAALPNWLKGIPAVVKRTNKETKKMSKFDTKDLSEDAKKAFAALEEAAKKAEEATEAAEATAKEAEEKVTKAEADLVEAQKGDKKDPEPDVLKGLSPELQKALDARQAKSDEAIAKAQEQADTATKAAEVATEVAKAEREKRERKEYADIAKADLGGLNIEGLGDQLYDTRQSMTDEQFELHMTTLKAASTQANTAMLLKEVGAVASGTVGGAWDEVEALAKVMVEKDGAPTQAQAVTKVLEQNPELYDRYRAEQREA